MGYGVDSKKIFNTVQSIVRNNADTPWLIAEITSDYIGGKEIDSKNNSKINIILKQIKLTCRKYDESMKYEGDKKNVEEVKNGYSNLICGLVKGNTLENLLNQFEDTLEQSDDEDFSKTG